MATLLPGVRARMGRWTYYMVRMTMNDLRQVKFASEIEEGNALDDTLQRVLKTSRAKSEIATYLQRQQDRFFNSLVIASIGGEPKWFPISIEDDPQLALIADDETLLGSFGVLRFNGKEDYFALDGQHRLAAIKEMLDPESDLYRNRPEGFEHEEQSVVLVFPSDAETIADFKERFRRLFGNLNRYAKPMDDATSIIVEEDDVVAIATRRLFSDHEFFKAVGPERESLVVDTTAGKNITNPRQPHLTKLEVLYSMNKALLDSRMRQTNGWFDSEESLDQFIRFRPEDSIIEAVYRELSTYWDAILTVLPDLRGEAPKMRNHAIAELDGEEDLGEERDHLLFWPIGQKLLAEVARQLMDKADVAAEDIEAAEAALAPLGSIVWDLNELPWRHFLLVPNENGKWVMRSENRAKAITLAASMLNTACTYGSEVDEVVLESLKDKWATYLTPAMTKDQVDQLWPSVLQNLGM